MKNKIKICLIPIYGSIIYFFIITIRLAKIGKRNVKNEFRYLVTMAFLGSIGMLMAGLLLKVLQKNFEGKLIIYIVLSVLFVWPLITLPVIQYSNKAKQIFENAKNEE